LLIPPEVDDR